MPKYREKLSGAHFETTPLHKKKFSHDVLCPWRGKLPLVAGCTRTVLSSCTRIAEFHRYTRTNMSLQVPLPSQARRVLTVYTIASYCPQPLPPYDISPRGTAVLVMASGAPEEQKKRERLMVPSYTFQIKDINKKKKNTYPLCFTGRTQPGAKPPLPNAKKSQNLFRPRNLRGLCWIGSRGYRKGARAFSACSG